MANKAIPLFNVLVKLHQFSLEEWIVMLPFHSSDYDTVITAVCLISFEELPTKILYLPGSTFQRLVATS